jgi:hypothetical protein
MGDIAQVKEGDPTYRDASYLGTDEDDSEDPQDLGFIVDDHDDRRATLTGGWQRLDDLDTDEPLEINPKGPIPHEVALRERGASPEWFAKDYYVEHAAAEAQENDFVETSMLQTDPDGDDGADDFTNDSFRGLHGETATTDIAGHVRGVTRGVGSSVPQDLGSGGFQIRDNPLAVEPLTEDQLAALQEDEDDIVDEAELMALAEQGVQERLRDVG